LTDAPVQDSPCTGVCRLNPEGTCVGCGRTLDEITEWPVAEAARRGEIRRLAQLRYETLKSHV